MKKHQLNNETENSEYVKFIADNFDTKCDYCDVTLLAYHDARRHYKQFHGIDKGYLKCCKVKLRELWLVKDHIESHLNPNTLKWVQFRIDSF